MLIESEKPPPKTSSIDRIDFAEQRVVCVFNWSDEPCDLAVHLPGSYAISDYWTQKALGRFHEIIHMHMAPHSARLLTCYPADDLLF